MSYKYEEGDKLYVVVRNDLSPGLQIAQSIHAKDEFSMTFPDVNKAWFEQSNYICVLQIANEESLVKLMEEATVQKIKHTCFIEPDLNDQVTAAAFEPSEASKELCKNLELALK